MNRAEIRQTIKDTCKQKGWDFRRLSRESGVSMNAIERFVAGRDQVSTPVIMRLFKALGIETRG